MTAIERKTKRAMRSLEEVSSMMKGIIDEARVQAHLGAMEAKKLEPYLSEVAAFSKAAARDLVKRGKELEAQLRRLRREYEAR